MAGVSKAKIHGTRREAVWVVGWGTKMTVLSPHNSVTGLKGVTTIWPNGSRLTPPPHPRPAQGFQLLRAPLPFHHFVFCGDHTKPSAQGVWVMSILLRGQKIEALVPSVPSPFWDLPSSSVPTTYLHLKLYRALSAKIPSTP